MFADEDGNGLCDRADESDINDDFAGSVIFTDCFDFTTETIVGVFFLGAI